MTIEQQQSDEERRRAEEESAAIAREDASSRYAEAMIRRDLGHAKPIGRTYERVPMTAYDGQQKFEQITKE